MAGQVDLSINNDLPNFLQKWQKLSPQAQQVSPAASNAVFSLDMQRLKAGQQPYTQNELASGLQSANTLQNVLPSQQPKGLLGLVEHIPSAAVHDLQNVLTSIPKLPATALHEVQALPGAPAAISQAISDHSIGELAKAPGIRDLPFSFTLGNLGHPTQFLKHPVMSVLDLAPAEGAAVDMLPEEFKNAISQPIANTLDKFGVGPISSGSSRIVNVAERQALNGARDIVENANRLAEGLTPEEKQMIQDALVAAPRAESLRVGQMELPGVTPGTGELPPELMDKLSQRKEAMESLKKIQQGARQTAVNTIANAYGKSETYLKAQYGEQAAQLAADTGADVNDAFHAILQREGLNEFRPHQVVPGTKAIEGERLYVPETVNQVLTRMFNPHLKTGIGSVYDKAMGLFRTAVLPLSVHWHLVHTTGMLGLLAADTGPSVFKYAREAYQMAHDGTVPHEISQLSDLNAKDIMSGKFLSEDQSWNLMKGKELQDMLNGNKFKDYAAQVGKPLDKLITGSYRVSGMIDRMGGAMAYLYGRDKALGEGLTEAEGHAVGIKQANGILHDWDGMTPVERQVIRSVFPFYGWMKTIGKYVLKYPVNHPLRTSIMTNFAKVELEDAKSGIPEEYRNYFLFGKPNSKGDQKAAYISRLNPFSDVTSMFTLGGLLSQTNPFIGGILDAVGINPQTGAGQAFPHVVYNPMTGKQEAAHQNAIESIVQNFVPQETAISRLLGVQSKDQQALKLTNPNAYANEFWSSLGLPALRTVNMPKVAAQAEINRQQALIPTLDGIIKSGNFGQLRNYNSPELNQVADKLEALQKAGYLKQFTNSKNGVTKLDTQKVYQLLGL